MRLQKEEDLKQKGLWGNDFKTPFLNSVDAAGGDYSFIKHNTDGDLEVFARNTGGATNTIFKQSTSEKLRIQAGGGISFNGDTAAANALDDYEEGTWTPAPSSAGNAFQVAVGTYTKVGRCVTALFRVRIAASEGAGYLQINGLPFDNIAGEQGEAIGNISFTTADTSGNMYAAVSTGTAILFYFGTGTNMRYNSSGVPNSHIRGGVVYYTAA